MAIKIQLRGDTKANWETVNPILAEREMVIEIDTNRTKIGNGTDNYNDLPYSDSFADANAVTRQSLSNLKQRFYRNLEGDNLLPLVDYEGRTRPVGTAMEMVDKITENGTTFYIVANMPYIKDLLQNPTNWLIFADTTSSDYLPTNGWTEYTFTAVKILTSQYIGNYEAFTNCCKFSTNTPIIHKLSTTLGIGDKIFVMSFKAYGSNIRADVAFPINGSGDVWNKSQTLCSFIFKHSDGTFRSLVLGANNTRSLLTMNTSKLMKADNPMTGAWELVFNNDDSDIQSVIPSPYVGHAGITGIFKKTGSDSMYISAIGLFETPINVNKIGLFEFNEDFTYKKIILVDLSGYTFENGLGTQGFGISYVNYKGKHLISLMDGMHNSGKRVILMSDNYEGVYSLHSTVYDWSNAWMKASGSMFHNSIANCSLFVYNNDLYHFTSGEPSDVATGLSSKHQSYLWKYDDAKNTWNPIVLPWLIALHGNPTNYPELTGAGQAHLGSVCPCFVDGNKLWLAMQIRDFVGYKGTVGYIDLNEALK